MVARSVNPGGVSRLVALKRILPRLASDQFIVDQFLDEAKLGMRFDHQNLVTAMTSEMPAARSSSPWSSSGVDLDSSHLLAARPAQALAGQRHPLSAGRVACGA